MILTAMTAIALPAAAQQAPEGLPAEKGVYYRADSNWVPLPRTLLLPFMEGEARQVFGFGGTRVNSQLSGAHALVRSGARPTFYVRGFSPFEGIYLIKGRVRNEYRVLPMTMRRNVFDGPEFHRGDGMDLEIRSITADLVSLQPRTDLKPGEYAIVVPPGGDFRWLGFGYSFGVPATTGTR